MCDKSEELMNSSPATASVPRLLPSRQDTEAGRRRGMTAQLRCGTGDPDDKENKFSFYFEKPRGVYEVYSAALAILLGPVIFLLKEDRQTSGGDYKDSYGLPKGKVDRDQTSFAQVAFEEFCQEIGICDKHGNLTSYSERLLPYKVLLHMWRSLREAAPEAMVVAGMPLMVYRVPEVYSDDFMRLPQVHWDMFEGHIPGEADGWTRSAREILPYRVVPSDRRGRFYLEGPPMKKEEVSYPLKSSLFEMFGNVRIPEQPEVNPAVALVTDEAAAAAEAEAAAAAAAAKAAETAEAAVAAEAATASLPSQSLAWCGEGTLCLSRHLQEVETGSWLREWTRNRVASWPREWIRNRLASWPREWIRNGWDRGGVIGHGPGGSWRRQGR